MHYHNNNEVLYYKFRNKLYQSIHYHTIGNDDFVDIYQINRLIDPTSKYDYLEAKYHKRLSKEEFTRFIEKFGLMLWETKTQRSL